MLVIVILLVALGLFSSCSQSGKAREVEPKEQMVILRGKSLKSGVISPLLVAESKDIYKVGDTVWVHTTSGIIKHDYDYKVVGNGSIGTLFQAYKIEKTPTKLSEKESEDLQRSLDRLNRVNWDDL